MVDNIIIKEVFADIISDMGYKISYDDINGSAKNVIGIYLRTAGDPLKGLGKYLYERVDITIRLHGDTESGSQKRCEEDLAEIAKRLTFYNRRFTGINILGSSLRGRGVMLGKTKEGIPVYNISFLVQFN